MHPRELATLVVIILALLVPWVTVRDVWRHPVERWRDAGRSRITATVVVLAIPIFGPAWYVRHIRPQIRVEGGRRFLPWRRGAG